MTTYTLTGFGTRALNGIDTAFIPDAELKVVAASGSGFDYSITGAGQALPQIQINADAYHFEVEGQPLHPFITETFIGSLTWSGGTTTVLNVVVHTGSNTDEIYLFRLDGAAFPAVNSLAELSALEQSVTSAGTPTGAFAPNTQITWDQLAHTSVSENDRIVGGRLDDLILGGRGRDRISGGDGEDTLSGGGGRDLLSGGTASDMLDGGNGNDILHGNGGRDTLAGGRGNDILNGGNGGDSFVFANGFGTDTITDFDALAKSEKIDLSAVTRIRHFNDLSKNHMDQIGDDVVINDGRGNSITLLDTVLGDLDRSDFIF